MTPVFVIDGKVRSCLDQSDFFHSSYDESDVVNNEILVIVEYTSASFLVGTPCGKKLGGKMVVRIACNVFDEG